MTPKRSARLLVSLALLLAGAAAAHAETTPDWQGFKHNFVSPEGRVIDFFQDQSSHSEGQGYGMLLAAFHDDEATFARLWKWSADNLRVRKTDFLFAWKWGQRLPGKWEVIDFNNATDGDTLIAWALLIGAEKWQRPDYRQQALEIIRSIREHLVLKRQNRLYILPGYFGFVEEAGLRLNPSYLILPAYAWFARYDDAAFWRQVHEDGLRFIGRCSAFSDFRLPPDWVLLKESALEINGPKGGLFGFEAMRILLYLSWDGNLRIIPGAQKLLDHVQQCNDTAPRHIDLLRNSISLEEAPGGFYAVLARAAAGLDRSRLAAELRLKAQKKVRQEDRNYFSHVLYLLSEASFKP